MLIKKTNKKAVSIMIGYVLLITFAIIMSTIVYQWAKTYVPKESLDCPDGVSISIKEFSCEQGTLSTPLNLTLENNGRFNIAGYFIHGTNDSGQELATIDLSQYLNEFYGGGKIDNSVLFMLGGGDNSFVIDDEPKMHVFELKEHIYSIEIIPIRIQGEGNKKRFVSCGDVKIKEIVNCSAPFIGKATN